MLLGKSLRNLINRIEILLAALMSYIVMLVDKRLHFEDCTIATRLKELNVLVVDDFLVHLPLSWNFEPLKVLL